MHIGAGIHEIDNSCWIRRKENTSRSGKSKVGRKAAARRAKGIRIQRSTVMVFK
jgi:hypothetical protein